MRSHRRGVLKKTIHAAVAVIERDGQLLICQRHHHDSFGGLWEFPGGKRETGETWEACVAREVLEEVGVRISRPRPCGWMRHAFRDGVVIFKIFRCTIAEGDPSPREARQLRWVQPQELPQYQFPPANRGLIARLCGARQRRMV